ncbi:hypothetical protein BYT27DRAFT_7240960 [Phlegmacium glaucopus]|nr:hypothetical protein BYT27DRAFT_7240960 [Phlegmacium glaucopus]
MRPTFAVVAKMRPVKGAGGVRLKKRGQASALVFEAKQVQKMGVNFQEFSPEREMMCWLGFGLAFLGFGFTFSRPRPNPWFWLGLGLAWLKPWLGVKTWLDFGLGLALAQAMAYT